MFALKCSPMCKSKQVFPKCQHHKLKLVLGSDLGFLLPLAGINSPSTVHWAELHQRPGGYPDARKHMVPACPVCGRTSAPVPRALGHITKNDTVMGFYLVLFCFGKGCVWLPCQMQRRARAEEDSSQLTMLSWSSDPSNLEGGTATQGHR